MANARLPGRDEWRRIQAQGMRRFLVQGALRRAIPMTILALVLLELFEGGAFTRERLASAAFLERLVLALAVFSAGGAISAYARWRSFQALYGDGST